MGRGLLFFLIVVAFFVSAPGMTLAASSETPAASSNKPTASSDKPPASNNKKIGAEYAIRWNIAEGGPQTVEETLKLLGPAAGDTDEYSVVYFNVKTPEDAPSGFASILRQRTKKNKTELMFKYRGRSKLANWKCPLPNPTEAKEEVDQSFAVSGVKRVFSYSCTIEADKPIEPPAALQASNPCTSKMTRTKAGNLKIEVWELPRATKVIEVSRNGEPQKKDREAFGSEIVAKLKRAGAKPLDSGMAELGKRCK